jgi:hypothetical protein
LNLSAPYIVEQKVVKKYQNDLDNVQDSDVLKKIETGSVP